MTDPGTAAQPPADTDSAPARRTGRNRRDGDERVRLQRRCLDALALTGGRLGFAARRLHLSQTALRAVLQSIEQDLGLHLGWEQAPQAAVAQARAALAERTGPATPM